MTTTFSRRRFLQSSIATGAALTLPMPFLAAAPRRGAWRPNDEICVAVAGIRSRGRAHINGFHKLDNVRVVAVVDPDRSFLERERDAFAKRNESLDTYTDVRDVLERDDIDVLAIATPNHWHSLMGIWACQAGKDVYCEKPISHNIWEGRQLVHAARKYDRIVQTGTQSRSSFGIRQGIEWIQSGNLGRITIARGFCYKPRQSIGKVSTETPIPEHIDYNLWTGPAPLKPLMRKNLHYDWHWVFDTGNGDVGNQGIHQMDQCRWALGAHTLSPAVGSIGGRFGYEDDGNTPNTQIVFHDYEPAPLLFEVRGLPRDKKTQQNGWNGGGMDKYRGVSIGAIIDCEGGYLRLPDYNSAIAYDNEGKQIKKWAGSDDHFQNFIDAVRSRKMENLNSEIEEGHLSSALCHMGNVSHLTGTTAGPGVIRNAMAMGDASGKGFASEAFDRFCTHLDANEVDLARHQPVMGSWLKMDVQRESFIGRDDANALLRRTYREPFVVPETV